MWSRGICGAMVRALDDPANEHEHSNPKLSNVRDMFALVRQCFDAPPKRGEGLVDLNRL